MTHRSFTNPEPEAPPERISFDLNGTYSATYREKNPETPETWTEEFTLVEEAPVGVLALYERVAASSGRGDTIYSSSGLMSFLAAVIDENVDSGRSRFYNLCDDPNRLIRKQLLVDVLDWVAEKLTLRPTGPATISPDGSPDEPTSSEDD